MNGRAYIPESVLKRGAEILSREVDEETVLLDPESGSYFALNETGTAIWNLIEEPMALAEVQKKLLELFEVEAEEAWEGIVDLVGQLVGLGLAEVVGP